jgi:hypothetical protein
MVVAKSAVEYNRGELHCHDWKLELVNDPYLFYRLTNAEPVVF